MSLRAFNSIVLVVTFITVMFSGQISAANPAYTFCSEIPGKLEFFVREEPRAAAAVIAALASVIIFKDVVITGAQKTIKTIKKNPIISLGVSLILAGAAYGCWDHYYNNESDFIEKMLDSVQDGTQSFMDALSSHCSKIRRSFAGMTYEDGQKVCDTAAKAKEFLQ